MGTSSVPEARLKIIAENLARAALQELQRDVKAVGTEAGGASAGFNKMVFSNGQLIASTTSARRGLTLLQNGIQNLAFHAAGIPGPVGKAAQGIGMLGIGSLWVTGGIAGLGAVAIGMRLLTKDAREASKAAEELAKSVAKLSVGDRLREIQADLSKASRGAVESRAEAISEGGGFNPFLHLIAGFRSRAEEKAGQDAIAAVQAIRKARGDTHREAIQALELEASLIGLSVEEQARLTAAAKGYTIEETNRLVIAARNLEIKKEEQRALNAMRDVLEEINRISAEVSQTFDPSALQGIAIPSLKDIQRGDFVKFLDPFDEARLDAIEFFSQPPSKAGDKAGIEAAINQEDKGGINRRAAQMAVLGALQIGGGNVMAGLGSTVTGLSGLQGISQTLAGPLGWAGFGLSALGAAFGNSNRDAERRHREELEELRRIRENTDQRDRPARSDLHIYLDGEEITDRVMYQIGRAERSDATPRRPRR